MTDRDIVFGVFVPQGWKMDLVSIDGAQAKWAKAVEVAQLAERLGFDSLWVYDHFHNVPRPATEAVFECWTTIAAISPPRTHDARNNRSPAPRNSPWTFALPHSLIEP